MSGDGEIYARLKTAIGTGEIIGLLYHGGSQPGSYREIVPLQIVEHQVRARCRTSGAVKVFALAKIELRERAPEASETTAVWGAAEVPIRAYASLDEVEAAHREDLERVGWHVVLTRDEDGVWLSLHRKTKAGKPLKASTLMLSFEPTTWDSIFMPGGGAERSNVRPRARPWGFRGRAKSGTWGDSSKAVAAFLQEASTYP